MKAILIIVLIVFSICQDEVSIPGGWEKSSIYENNIEILLKKLVLIILKLIKQKKMI